MADQVQWRGGSRQNSDQFTGAPREVTVDTSDWILRVHDGVTPGGHKMMKVNDCLKVETADKCNPNAPSCQVTVNGQLEVGGEADFNGDVNIDGNTVIDGNLDIIGKGDLHVTGDFSVEGKTHLTDLNVTGCITNEANPCGLNEPVTVCDDFKVTGSSELQDVDAHNLVVHNHLDVKQEALFQDTVTVPDLHVTGCISNPTDPCGTGGKVEVCDDMHISGDLWVDGTIHGDFEFTGDTSNIPLRNPGDYYGDCNVKPGLNLQTQADANKWFYEAIKILDIELCLAQQEIIILEKQYQELEVRVDQNEIDIAALKKEIDNLKQEIIDIENAIKLLEIEIEKNQQDIEQNAIDIAKLQVEVENLKQDVADIKTEINAIKNELNDLSNKVDGIEVNLEQLTDRVDNLVLNDLKDVTTLPNDGDALIWDAGQQQWINSTVGGGGATTDELEDLLKDQALDDHIDCMVPNPKDHDVLTWDDRLQQWVAKSPLSPPPAIQVKGVINVGAPAPQGPKPGDLWIHHDPGVSPGPDDTVSAEGSWVGISGQPVHEGEYVIYSTDNEWHHTGNEPIELQALQSDWEQTDPLEPDYIHNKPDIPDLIDTHAGDGAINVNAGPGLVASGNNATANQNTDTTRTLSAKVDSGIIIDGNGSIIIDPNFNLDGNITEPGDGQINVNAGQGIAATGLNATANQTGDTTRTLSAKVGAGLDFDASGNIIIDPNYNLDGNVTKPNDGKLTIKDSDGATVGEFTANQLGDSDVTLPAPPEVNDGKLTIRESQGQAGGVVASSEFTANQADNTDVVIGNGVFELVDHEGNLIGDFWANQTENEVFRLPAPPIVNNGKLTIKNCKDDILAEFTANQAGNTEVKVQDCPVKWDDIEDIPECLTCECVPIQPTFASVFVSDAAKEERGKLPYRGQFFWMDRTPELDAALAPYGNPEAQIVGPVPVWGYNYYGQPTLGYANFMPKGYEQGIGADFTEYQMIPTSSQWVVYQDLYWQNWDEYDIPLFYIGKGCNAANIPSEDFGVERSPCQWTLIPSYYPELSYVWDGEGLDPNKETYGVHDDDEANYHDKDGLAKIGARLYHAETPATGFASEVYTVTGYGFYYGDTGYEIVFQLDKELPTWRGSGQIKLETCNKRSLGQETMSKAQIREYITKQLEKHRNK